MAHHSTRLTLSCLPEIKVPVFEMKDGIHARLFTILSQLSTFDQFLFQSIFLAFVPPPPPPSPRSTNMASLYKAL